MSGNIEQTNIDDKVYFLITSYLSGNFVTEKKTHILDYLKRIKKYIPNSFILFVDSIPDIDIAEMCDIYVCETKNNNIPHGQGDLEKVRIGINILDGLGSKWFVRSSYDYWMNETIVNRIGEWKSMIDEGKQIISTRWRGENYEPIVIENMVSMGYGCYTIEGAKRLFNFENFSVHSMAEEQLYVKLTDNFVPEEYYLYDTCENMFGGIFFDVFNYGGNSINQRRVDTLRNNDL